MMTSATTDLSAELLQVLADPLRWQIVQLLSTEALCTCHLVEETGARQTNVSNHLRILRRAGVVQTEPSGRYTYYRLSPGALSALAEQLGVLTESAEHVQRTGTRRPCP